MSLNQQLSDLIRTKVQKLYNLEKEIKLEIPKDTKFGDFACNIAMQIVKETGKNPREIAQEIIDNIPENDLIEKMEIAGPGFLNITLKNEIVADVCMQIDEKYGNSDDLKNQKIIVEFACPNTHKAFHIGHFRNICLGEALTRIIDSQGTKSFRANYNGDVGLHVAKCLWAILKNNKLPLEKGDTGGFVANPLEGAGGCLPTNLNSPQQKAEYLGKVYAIGGTAYEEDEQAKKEIHEINKQIYARDPEIMPLWEKTRQWSLEYFDYIYERLGSHFDKLFFESESFEIGKKTVLEYLKKGVFEESDGAIIFDGEKYGFHKRVFITKEGNPTYEAKDLGLLQLQKKTVEFDRIIHIVANEQAEYFKVLFEAMEQIEAGMKAKQYHLSYGMVNLTSGKMSSRTGDVITAEWLIDEAKKELTEILRETDLSEKEKIEINEKVAIGAIKFAMLHTTAKNDIAFNLEEAVKIHGDSGPYLQYAYTRISSILRNFSSVILNDSEGSRPPIAGDSSVAKLPQNDTSFETFNESDWTVAKKLIYFPEIISKCANEYSPHYLTRYLLDLSALFSSWYEQNSVKDAEPNLQKARLQLLQSVRQVLKNGLYLLGIETVERM